VKIDIIDHRSVASFCRQPRGLSSGPDDTAVMSLQPSIFSRHFVTSQCDRHQCQQLMDAPYHVMTSRIAASTGSGIEPPSQCERYVGLYCIKPRARTQSSTHVYTTQGLSMSVYDTVAVCKFAIIDMIRIVYSCSRFTADMTPLSYMYKS